MPNISSVLNAQIRRLSRREIKSETKTTKKLTGQYRRDIAALKRQVAALAKTVGFLEAQEKKRSAQQPAPEKVGDIRFRADGLKSHRAKLGISAKDYGRLVGVAGLTIYQWESGKAHPRRAQLAKLAAVRGMGKREAIKRLETLDGGPGAAAAEPPRRRGGQTAEELVLALVKSRQATTSSQINAAWKKAGRPGLANNTLSRMVKAGKLNRSKLKDGRGSQYSVK